MERNQIFKAEGGYRIAVALHGDNPIMEYCVPWFATLNEARIEREKLRLKSEKEIEIENGMTGSEEEISNKIEKIESKYNDLIQNAQPVIWDNDPQD